MTQLLLTGNEETVPLPSAGRGAVDVALNEVGFDLSNEVPVFKPDVVSFTGTDADDDNTAFDEVKDAELDVKAGVGVDALLVSFIAWASVSFLTFILALLSPVEDAAVVPLEDDVPSVVDMGAPLASSSAPK